MAEETKLFGVVLVVDDRGARQIRVALRIHCSDHPRSRSLCRGNLEPTDVGISSQLMWIHWPKGHVPKSHAPDYFARHRKGDGEIIDVRPERLIDENTAAVFEATRVLCAEVGFRYRVISDLSPQLDRNLKFLSPYRDRGWAPPTEAMRSLASLGGTSILGLAQHLCPDDVTLGLGQAYWLIWHQAVRADLNQLLSARTRVIVSEVER